MDEESYMEQALVEAKKAAERNEVPIGCVVVSRGAIIGRGHNLRESLADPAAHAEILALRQAAGVLGHWRVSPATCYVTCEPCPMCAGAMVNARVDRLVFGCREPKSGACGSLYNIAADRRLNHTMEVTGGVMEDQCLALLQDFFQALRVGS